MAKEMSVQEARARLDQAGASIEKALADKIRQAPGTALLVALAAGILAGQLSLPKKAIFGALRVFLG